RVSIIVEQDYILRMIRECVAVAMKMFFGINPENPEIFFIRDQEKQDLSNKLILKLQDGNIREVLSELHAITGEHTKDDLLIGLEVYSHLMRMDENFLDVDQIDYPEIREDMKSFFAQYGISDTLFDLIFFG
ncbi:MAG: hypothetical protein K2G25_02615, partial [Oscillospiraceae bacterium]|nr:hypothetical protein [Oscillospiraceae bacterium]